jgi:hypothetical protein
MRLPRLRTAYSSSEGRVELTLRHAAELALVGWYLLVPPQTRTWWIGEERYDDAAPLNRWTIERSFDRADICDAARWAAQEQTGDAAVRMNHAVARRPTIPASRGIRTIPSMTVRVRPVALPERD